MSKTLLAVLAVAVAILAGAYWYNGEKPTGDAAQKAQIANPASVNCVEVLGGQLDIVDEEGGQVGYCHLPDGRVCEEWALMRDGACNAPKIAAEKGVECYDGNQYFVLTKERDSDVGEDILVKRKDTPTQTLPCAYSVAPGDIELAEEGPTYYLGLTGVFLMLDHGTAPPPRGLTVYDMKKGKEVYADQYNQPFETSDGTFTYWQPTDTKPTTANCPDLAQLEESGLGAGIERHVRLDLATLKVTDFKEIRCSARQ